MVKNMKKIVLNVPNRLFDHLSNLPTFLNDDIKDLMSLPPAIRAEAEVLYKLNELYCNYDEDTKKMESMANACEKRLNEIEKLAKRKAKNG